jgi:hypothetical protein
VGSAGGSPPIQFCPSRSLPGVLRQGRSLQQPFVDAKHVVEGELVDVGTGVDCPSHCLHLAEHLDRRDVRGVLRMRLAIR